MSTDQPGQEFLLPLRVYMEDTDAGGIVYYVNYLKFMERARTEFMRRLGFGRDYIFNADLMFVVRDVSVKYHSPARLDDELAATACLHRLGGASMVIRQRLLRADTLLAEGDIRIACVDRSGVDPRPMPGAMRARLASFQEGETRE